MFLHFIQVQIPYLNKEKHYLSVFNRCFERQGNGAIVNIVCDMFRGFPMMSHTGAARAAVENLTR